MVAGQTPAEAIAQTVPPFPNLFANLYASGEISGKLDETLRRLYAHYQEEGSHKLQMFAQWMPRLIYVLVAADGRLQHHRVLDGSHGPHGDLSHIINGN